MRKTGRRRVEGDVNKRESGGRVEERRKEKRAKRGGA